MIRSSTFATKLLLPLLTQAYRDGVNFGGDGFTESSAQIYKFFGDYESKTSLVVSIWEERDDEASLSTFKGDINLSVIDAQN